jgi:hypothetical protein
MTSNDNVRKFAHFGEGLIQFWQELWLYLNLSQLETCHE